MKRRQMQGLLCTCFILLAITNFFKPLTPVLWGANILGLIGFISLLILSFKDSQ